MLHLVGEGTAAPVPAESPVVLLEEVLVAVLRGLPGRPVARHLDAMIPSVPAKTPDGGHRRPSLVDPAVDRSHEIRLVVKGASEPRDEEPRHELADEHDAAARPLLHIEAQVQLGEVAEARPGNAEHSRVEEIEGDQARERRASSRVEGEPGGQVRLEERGRRLVGQDGQVGPAGGENGSPDGLHGHGAHGVPSVRDQISGRLPWVARTTVLIPPRTLKSPTTSIQRGPATVTKSLRMRLVTSSWKAPSLR